MRRKTSTPLTPEQQKLAEENANLIWWFINYNHLGGNDPEQQNDWYSVIARGYIQAAQDYDPSRGSFATLARCCMTHAWYNELRARRRNKRTAVVVSLDAPCTEGGCTEGGCTLGEVVPDSYQMESAVMERISIEQLLNRLAESLTAQQMRTLCHLIHGLSPQEMAQREKICNSTARNRLFRLRKAARALKEEYL